VELSEDNHKQLWVPPGFAHGLLVLSESAEFLCKTTDYYAPQHERSLAWNDPALAIDWPLDRLHRRPATPAVRKGRSGQVTGGGGVV
jgi:dTDP-4-dehydrorhamnose 3,5-epimerase-like enzyme